MATAPSKRSSAVANLAKTLTIKVDGEDIHVPVGKAENMIHNCLMVSQVRQLVQVNIKRIKDMEQTISPKELKDLVDAVGRLAESSALIYNEVDGEIDTKEKTAEKIEKEDEAIDADFTAITKPNANDIKPADSTPVPKPDPGSDQT